MSKPAYAANTAIELGLENPAGTARTANLLQIPVHNAKNPWTADMETQPMDPAQATLDPVAPAIGMMSGALAGEFYLYPSGITNLAPDWFQIIEACGWGRTRRASKANPSDTLAAAGSGSGGSIADGDYNYKFTMLLKADGTTPATTRAEAVYESQLNATLDTVNLTGGNDNSVAISTLPATGIKRVYRTEEGPGATYKFVGEVASGTQTLTDTLADINLGIEAPIPSIVTMSEGGTPVIELVASVGAGSLTAGAYGYKVVSLVKADGRTGATAAADVVHEILVAQATITLGAGENTVDFAGLNDVPDGNGVTSNGRKRIYRTVVSGSTYKVVADVASGTDTYTDTTADGALGATAPAGLGEINEDRLAPVSTYALFKALTAITYLDGRKYPIVGARGSCDFSGDAGAQALARFNLRGAYSASIKVANPTTEVGDPGTLPQLCGANFTIRWLDPDTGNPASLTPVAASIGTTLGRTPAARRDINASCTNAGLREFLIAGRPDPHLTANIEFDEDVDFHELARRRVGFALDYTVGTADTPGQRIRFTNWWNNVASEAYRYLARIVAAPNFDTMADEVRGLPLDFLLAGTKDNFLQMVHH